MPSEISRSSELGTYLVNLRKAKGFSLRDVEEATGKNVSNAYLSQVENGHIKKPSPDMLYSLSEAYGVEYEKLMEKAGYLRPITERHPGERHGRVATFANFDLSAEEEDELFKYLAFIRSKK